MEGSAANSRRFLLPRSRRLTSDLLHFASKVPMCPHDRIVDLSELIALRKRLPKRISFAALFVKAYGLMAAECPVFRQLHFRWPVANVYEHKETVLMMTIAREFRDEPWVFWGRFQGPENRTLPEIQEQLERYQTADVKKVFRQQVQLSAFPTLIRRAVWWWNLNTFGRNRARRTGTAFLTTLASRGAEISNPPSLQTGCLSYGPFDDAGRSRVTIAYDHRLMDGATVATCLERLETILNGVVASELRDLINADDKDQQPVSRRIA